MTDYAREIHEAELDADRLYDARQKRYGANVPTQADIEDEK